MDINSFEKYMNNTRDGILQVLRINVWREINNVSAMFPENWHKKINLYKLSERGSFAEG